GARSGEFAPAGWAGDAAPSVAADELSGPQRSAPGQPDSDPGLALHKTGHLASAIDRNRQLVDPAGKDAFDVLLPQREQVIVPRGKVADIKREPGEARVVAHLSL